MNKLIYILTAGILVSLVSCEPDRNKETIDGGFKDMYIDTIGIHGVRHEIIVRELFYDGHRGFGGIMHSPECWCFKNDRINNKSTNPTTENVENSISESQYGALY